MTVRLRFWMVMLSPPVDLYCIVNVLLPAVRALRYTVTLTLPWVASAPVDDPVDPTSRAFESAAASVVAPLTANPAHPRTSPAAEAPLAVICAVTMTRARVVVVTVTAGLLVVQLVVL